MNEFQQLMQAKFQRIERTAHNAADYCADPKFECCAIYDQLLDLQKQLDVAIQVYFDPEEYDVA